MNLFSHLLFICSIVYLIIGSVVLFKDRKASLNRVFFALNLCLFIWSFSVAVMTVVPDKASCFFWNTLGSFGYCTFASVSLHFFLIYAKKDSLLKKWWFYVVLYLPAAVLLFHAISQNLYSSDFFHNQYGWIAIVNGRSSWFWMLILSIAISGMVNIGLCYSVFRKSESKREKKQSEVMLISALISFVLGMGLAFATKIFNNADIPDITVITFIVWLLGILYGMVKYRLMTLSPSLAAETILTTIIDPVILVSPQGSITYINSETLTLLGYEMADLLGKPFAMLFPEATKPEMEQVLKALENVEIRNKDTLFVTRQNTNIPILFSASACHDAAGDYLGLVVLARDISDYKQREEEIRFLSYHDQLTGLYNRRYYEEEIRRLDTDENLPLSIIMGDVNGLKIINDSIGHVQGDELLKKVAQAIGSGCRADDRVARLGGDEFVILLPKTDRAQAEQVIKRINALLTKEKVSNLDVSISFGCDVKKYRHEKIEDILKAAEDQMYKLKHLSSSSTQRNTIDLIMNALYEKNHREMLHSKRVGELCEAIALKMNFEKETVYRIKIAGLMHDIGKIGIDDKTLNKPDKLDPDEWEAMKKHPEIGQRILSAANEFSEIGDYIFEHQEKWDGTGYPRGLKGNEILLQARIIAVADSFDAMTSHRSYGKAYREEEAIREIKKCAGTQFDPEIARIFVEKVLGKKWDDNTSNH